MKSKITVGGHAVHPMLVAFPIAFYSASFVAFLVSYLGNWNPFAFRVALLANLAGVAFALLAAAPGLLDWSFSIPRRTAAKRVGARHLIFNVSALIFFGLNLYFQRGSWNSVPFESLRTVVLTGFGTLFTFLAGSLGWDLVSRYEVGVEPAPTVLASDAQVRS